MKNRTLFFGDNLEILGKKIPDEIFDLIYLDPPFNSNRSYNVLFKEGLQDSPAQVHAFEDSWHWTREPKQAFDELITKTTQNISEMMQAFEKIVGHNDMLAYLTMMTVRLIELHRVLKKNGSIYLHCDPTASHYLKIALDAIFGKNNFRNEIVWNYEESGLGTVRNTGIPSKHDIIFWYSKSGKYKYFPQYRDYKPEYKVLYTKKDKKGLYREKWRYKPDGTGYKARQYMKEGVPYSDVWNIQSLIGPNKERLGYSTQKPEALLERILKTSSEEGDWVLDPFCGCGTTVAVAERLKRKWVGVDITILAINLVKKRLRDRLGIGSKQIFIDGYPKDLSGAKELFKKDPFEFEYWALDLVNAVPSQSKSKDKMRGADKGIDGIIYFHKNMTNGNGNGNGKGKWEYGKVIVQIKGGGVQRNQIATLKGDVEREKAEAGIFITLEEPTKPMISEAVDAGSFMTALTGKMEFPKIQIITVKELLRGKIPNLPQGLVENYHKEAKPVEIEEGQTNKMDLEF